VALDKTGTLTDGELSLANPEAMEALSPQDRAALRAMAEASNHPHSRCLCEAVGAAARRTDLSVEERAGEGVQAADGSGCWRLGSPAFAGVEGAVDGSGPASCFTRADGSGAPRLLAIFRFRETERPDAREEIGALRRLGYQIQVLSGDTSDRAVAVGESLGVPAERCLGGLAPEQKADWLRAHAAERTLMLGDGINDSLAFGEAWCSGTPAVHRPFVPSKVDFYYLSPGLGPIREALALSKRLARVVRGLLGFALAYNALVVALAMAGFVTPIVAAITMPVSSVLIVVATSWAMTRESPPVRAGEG
jgi:Cu2+-exporting ATPase